MRILLIIAFLSVSLFAYADNSDKPCAIALEWWLEGQGKEGRISTKYDKKKQVYKITKWVVSGVQKPKKSELAQIIEDYEAQYVEPKTLQERLTELEQRVAALEP